MSILDSISSVLDTGLSSVDSVGTPGDLAGWIDSGSMSLNALASGSIFGGLPSNKITVYAGEPSVGKTFYLLEAMRSHLNAHEENIAVLFDSESAITSGMMTSHGIDPKRVSVLAVATIEEWRTKAMKILRGYQEAYRKEGFDEPRLFIGMDSIGNLSSIKEVTDVEEGSDKKDMTKAGLIRGAFRVLTIMCGETNTPMVCTNHVYDNIGGHGKTASGGKGPMYSASLVIFLRKNQHKDGDLVSGAKIIARNEKSRFTRERQEVETLLDFEKGLNPHFGLVDLAIRTNYLEKKAGRIIIDDKKIFEKTINNNPTEYWTKELLEGLDAKTKELFMFGSELERVVQDESEEEEKAE